MLRESNHEAELGHIAHLCLMIAIGMRRRLVPLIARELQISIDEHVLPWHKYIVEHDIVVGFVETARQRIVEGIVSAQGERPAWNELTPGALTRMARQLAWFNVQFAASSFVHVSAQFRIAYIT